MRELTRVIALMSEPFFAMRNRHGAYNRETEMAERRGGDASLQNAFPVADGQVGGVILGRDPRRVAVAPALLVGRHREALTQAERRRLSYRAAV